MRTFLAWFGLTLLVVCGALFMFRDTIQPMAETDPSPGPRREVGLVVVLDAGHGGRDSGAIRGRRREKTLALDLANRVAGLLRRRGIEVVMTRASDTFVSLGERVRVANRYPRSLFVSIHINVSTDARAKGIETYYHLLKKTGPGSKAFAERIQSALVDETAAEDRGVKARGFYVIRRTRSPAALVECGFLSNSFEACQLDRTAYRDKIADGLANGISAYYASRLLEDKKPIAHPRKERVNVAKGT